MNVDWGHGRSARSREGHAVLAADPLFQDRAGCLDGELVRAELGAVFPEVARSSLDPENVWYVPRKSLQVVYRASRPDAGGDTLIRVRFQPRGAGDPRPSAARPGGERGPVRLLPRLGAVGSLFPEDPELPQLGVVLDERWLARHLGPGGRWSCLSYLPGRRCALRYRPPGDPAGVVLRVQPPEEAARSDALVRAAWSAASRRFRMPEPLGTDPGPGASWERFVPGARLESLLGAARFTAALDEVVEGLVRLHGLRLPGLPAQGTADVVSRTAKVVGKARLALPSLGPALDAFAPLLAAAAARLPEAAPATLHGDLHTANLLITGDGVVFIDLDRMTAGDPAYDLALLGTRLLLVGLHGQARVHEVAGLVAGLPERYRAAGGRAVPDEVFAWHVAALLVGRQIKTAIRHLAPGAERLAPTLLAWARRALEQGRFDPSVVRPEVEVGDGREAANAA